MLINKADGYGADSDSVNYWIEHRSKLSDLYKSESYFLIDALKNSKTVLDIGCAAGGSALFTREANPSINYFGIDISANMIEAAALRFKNATNTKFLHFDGSHIPLEEKSIDLCFSLGVFHHVPDWKTFTREALRISDKFVLFDIRTWDQASLINSKESYQKLALSGNWDGISTIPYNIISFNELFGFLTQLKFEGISSKVYGYYGKPTELAVTPAKTVAMLSLLLSKTEVSPSIHFELN